MAVVKAAVGKRKEGGGRRSGKARVVDQTAGTTGTGFHALKYPVCRIYKGETKRSRRREPKIA
jgi:hypothetical protein